MILIMADVKIIDENIYIEKGKIFQTNKSYHGMLTMRSVKALIIFLLAISFPLSSGAWDFSRHNIPLEDITSGGPPKDGIPALMNPKYVKAKEAGFMHDDENILGVNLNGIARAYPTRILSWHESVNDTFGNIPALVSW
jgi:hypothetical protein